MNDGEGVVIFFLVLMVFILGCIIGWGVSHDNYLKIVINKNLEGTNMPNTVKSY